MTENKPFDRYTRYALCKVIVDNWFDAAIPEFKPNFKLKEVMAKVSTSYLNHMLDQHESLMYSGGATQDDIEEAVALVTMCVAAEKGGLPVGPPPLEDYSQVQQAHFSLVMAATNEILKREHKIEDYEITGSLIDRNMKIKNVGTDKYVKAEQLVNDAFKDHTILPTDEELDNCFKTESPDRIEKTMAIADAYVESLSKFFVAGIREALSEELATKAGFMISEKWTYYKKHIAYFLLMNPKHRQGDMCVAAIFNEVTKKILPRDIADERKH